MRSCIPITRPEPRRTLRVWAAFAANLRCTLHLLVGIAALGIVVATVLAAHGALAATWSDLVVGRRLPLVLAAGCAPLVPSLTSGAWRSVLASCGASLDVRRTWACYGAGSLANTFLPVRVGDALRVELFSRGLDHPRPRWLACGVATSVGVAQSIALGLVLAVGSLTGPLPLWAAAPSLAVPAVIVTGGRLALLRRPNGRVACLATASRLSIAAWSRLLVWITASALARLAVIASILDVLAVPHPLATAVIAIAGLALGSSLSFAPGGVGLGSATMAIALGHAGQHESTAVAAAVAFHVVETGAALAFGITGWLQLELGKFTSRRRIAVPRALATS